MKQKSVKIQVEYYDSEEQQKLSGYPSALEIQRIVEGDVEVPTEEFLTYYLFHKKRPGKPGYRNCKALGQKIGNALAEIEDWVDFSGLSISVPADVMPMENSITERIGESIGLPVTNRIHNLSEADWISIRGQIVGLGLGLMILV